MTEKPAVVVTESRHIPMAIQRYVRWRDCDQCVTPGCEATVGLELDHCPAWSLLVPKRHDPDKIVLRCKAHHSSKSRRDTTSAAKAKRLDLKHTGQYRPTKAKIPNRGFQKGPKRSIPSRPFGR